MNSQQHNPIVTKLIWSVFVLTGLIGAWASIDIGMGWDENAENATLQMNIAAIRGIFRGDLASYKALLEYGDRYYGIGFHVIANTISHLLEMIFPKSITNINPLILNHLSVWFSFLGASLIVRSLLYQLTSDAVISNLGMLGFLWWPYVLGHGLMNIKDMPFLFSWLLCTYISFSIVRSEKNTSLKIFSLAIASAWLLSIRISGILIFIQYGCLLFSSWVFCLLYKNNTFEIFKSYFCIKNILIFTTFFLIGLVLLYPITWYNPLELWNAIAYMGKHPWEGTTLTAGRFITPGNNLSLYFIVWFLAKLPAVVILGMCLIPVVMFMCLGEKNNLSNQERIQKTIYVGIFLSIFSIITILILVKANLYNELRQTLFLFPLLFLIGISSLAALNSKLCIYALAITTIFFLFDNLTIYPYNYSYLNEIARQRPAIQYFETDYFGFSAVRSARWLNLHPEYAKTECIYAYPTHLLSSELDSNEYPCVKDSVGNAKNIPTNSSNILYVTQRNLINFPIPDHCIHIHSEERVLPFSKNPLIMGKLFKCNNE